MRKLKKTGYIPTPQLVCHTAIQSRAQCISFFNLISLFWHSFSLTWESVLKSVFLDTVSSMSTRQPIPASTLVRFSSFVFDAKAKLKLIIRILLPIAFDFYSFTCKSILFYKIGCSILDAIRNLLCEPLSFRLELSFYL